MRYSVFSSSLIICAAALLTGCSGYSGYGYNNQNSLPQLAPSVNLSANGTCPAGMRAVASQYGNPTCKWVNVPYQYGRPVPGLRGPYPANYQQGTVIAANAPYSQAVGGHVPYRTAPRPRDNGVYMTAGATFYNAGDQGPFGDDLVGVQGRLGYNLNRYLGAEVEASTGVNNTNINADLERRVSHQEAIYAVGRLPLTPALSLLLRGGYHNTKINIDARTPAGTSTSLQADGFAWGPGVELKLSPKNSLRADYTIYDFDDQFEWGGASVSWVHNF